MPLAIGFKGYIMAPVTTWQTSWWNINGLVNDGRFAFFMINRTEYFSSLMEHIEVERLSLFDYICATLLGIGLMERSFHANRTI